MTALLLPRDRGPAVREDRQRIALTAPRPAGSPPLPPLGEDLQIALAAGGGRPRIKVGERRCILRAAVVITPTALVRVLDLRFHERDEHAGRAGSMANVLRQAEQACAVASPATLLQLAKLAGFRTWKALYDYNAHRDRRGRPDADGRVTREVIGWAA